MKISIIEKIKRIEESLAKAKFQVNFALFELNRLKEENTQDSKEKKRAVDQMLEDLRRNRE